MTRSADPYDELAAMFLTTDERGAHADTEGGPTDAGASPPPPTTEVLVIGHLPVRASLWLAPYADAVARDAGVTALVRLDGDEPMIQLLTGRGTAPPTPTNSRNLREAILQLGPTVARWIIRPSSRASMADVAEAGADAVTILSSADQVAIVNAYQIVKDMVDSRSPEPSC